MTQAVPLLDLKAQFAAIREEMVPAVLGVLESQRFVLGPEVEGLEREVAAYCGAHQAVGLSSGSDALLAALMALDVQAGDEVVTSPFTFFATAGAIHRLGARPVFADIDPRTFNLDPEKAAAAVTPRTKAVIPVHLFGQCADVEGLARAVPGVPILEDAAQAIGAARGGRRAGALGRAAAFSFFPSKNLGGLGDGGMVTTSDPELAERLRRLRNHGQSGTYEHAEVGGNFRLDAIQAAGLRVKLRHLDRWSEGRRRNADWYTHRIAREGLEEWVQPPAIDPECRHIYNQYTLRVKDRDRLREHLRGAGIGHAVYYPLPLHLQPCFAHLGHGEGDFPAAEKAAGEVISLPIYSELAEDQLERVVEAIRAFYRGR